MQLRFEVKSDDLLFHILLGPGETYVPEDNEEITQLHKDIQSLKTEIEQMRAAIDPKMQAIQSKVMELNKKLNSEVE